MRLIVRFTTSKALNAIASSPLPVRHQRNANELMPSICRCPATSFGPENQWSKYIR